MILNYNILKIRKKSLFCLSGMLPYQNRNQPENDSESDEQEEQGIGNKCTFWYDDDDDDDNEDEHGEDGGSRQFLITESEEARGETESRLSKSISTLSFVNDEDDE